MDSATLPDYLGKRYSPAVKLLASVMHICSNVALLSSQFTIACAVLYTITGFSMTLCLIICLLLVICLTSGGLRSVVNTDAVLFVIIVTSLVVAVPIVLHAGGGLGSIAARLPDGKTALTVHFPALLAVTSPFLSTAATFALSDAQVTLTGSPSGWVFAKTSFFFALYFRFNAAGSSPDCASVGGFSSGFPSPGGIPGPSGSSVARPSRLP